MTGPTAEQCAVEFRQMDAGEGWPYAVLIACCTFRGKRTDVANATRVALGVIPIKAWAVMAGTSDVRVGRYLDAWDRAAADGLVPPLDNLSPADAHSLPWPSTPWRTAEGGYYDPVSGGRPRDGKPADAVAIIDNRGADEVVAAMPQAARRDMAVALLADGDTRAAVEDATGMVVEPLSHTLDRVAEAEARQHHAAQSRDPHAVRLARWKGATEAHLADYPEDAQMMADWTATKAMEVQEARR